MRTFCMARRQQRCPKMGEKLHSVSKMQSQSSYEVRHSQIPIVDRFKHVHIDLIGPMPSSHGFNYCVTMRDRFTRWSEAKPIVEATAQQVAIAFISAWVAPFGIPEKITTDLGRQFESNLFSELTRLLGITHLKTTPYHPQANGMIERWHRALKSSIMCRQNKSWSEELPLILLAHRNAINEDVGESPAQLVYGTSLSLPGQFFEKKDSIEFQSEFVKQLEECMRELQPTSSSHHGTASSFIPKFIIACICSRRSHSSIIMSTIQGPISSVVTEAKTLQHRYEWPTEQNFYRQTEASIYIQRHRKCFATDEH